MTTKQIYTTPDSEWVILHSRPMMTTASMNGLGNDDITSSGYSVEWDDDLDD